MPLVRLASIAGSGLLLATAASGAAPARTSSLPLLASPARPVAPGPVAGRGRIGPAAAGCGTSNSASFVGIANELDVAGGQVSGVVSGYANEV